MTTNQDILTAIASAPSNPAQILQTVLDTMESNSNGEVRYVDPTNPVVSLFETSVAANTASVQQHIAALRGVYPSLAQTPDELYNHMSYRDYLNRFASPSTDPFIFFIPFSQFLQNARPVLGSDYSKITIPRGTRITINEFLDFTLQYPIDIKYFDTQGLEVSYDASIVSPLQSLTTNIIVSELIADPNSQERLIRFTVPAPQVAINKTTDNITKGRYFVRDIPFKDQFYIARAYYRNNSSGSWVEMSTTHSPVAYDPFVPTMQFKVVNNVLTASLPLVYQNNNLVSGELRVDVYTTKGALVVNLKEYPLESYVLNMDTLDPVVDMTEYASAALNVSIQCLSLSMMSGGKNELTFMQMRDRVIDNSLGPQEIPITMLNAQAKAQNSGFELVPHVDVVTDRIFLATRKLPRPTNQRLVTSANIGISTYLTEDPVAINHDWVRVHGKRVTFLSKNLYESTNGILRLLPRSEVDFLLAMESSAKLANVNSRQYLYTPFYYVLDMEGEELQVRPYQLDQPTASDLNFVDQNTTLQLPVNTASYEFRKVDEGYILRIQTRSGDFYKRLPDSQVAAQLSVLIPRSTRHAFWNGMQVGKTTAGERIFEFFLKTDYDINENDQIVLVNGKLDSLNDFPVEIDLASLFNIFHITTSITDLYVPSPLDEMIARFMLTTPCAAVTREQLKLEMGDALSRLWTRATTVPDTDVYETYSVDVPLVYDKDVYADPPFNVVDGQVVYNVLFQAGEVVTRDGEVVYAHRKGDVVLVDGKPIVSSKRIGQRLFDIMMVDGRHYFVNDPAYLAYNQEFISTIVDWVSEDIPALQQTALEKTRIYFYPKNQLTSASVLVADYTEIRIPSEQSPVVDVYVSQEIYRSTSQRQILRTSAINYLDTWISGSRMSISEAIEGLKDVFGAGTVSIMVSGLGGDRNLQLVNIPNGEQRLCLKRVLSAQQDGTFIIQEDVTVNFHKADPAALK